MSADRTAYSAPTKDFSTTDAGRALEYVRAWAADAPRVRTVTRELWFRFTSSTVDDFHVDTIEYSTVGEALFRPQREVAVAHLLSGRLEFATAGDTVRLRAGQSYLLPAGSPVRVRWENVRLGLVRVAMDEVERVIKTVRAVDAVRFHFVGGRPASHEAEQYWLSLLRHVYRDVLPNRIAARSELVQTSLGGLMAAVLLETFPNTWTSRVSDGEPSGRQPPAALRRATTFIEQHADESIDLEQIARAARVSPRSLQENFRSYWDTTPTAYLRRIRLERAHHDLLAADPTRGDTVAAVAVRWRCGHVGRFAARYRAVYGTTPYETLRS